MMKILKPILIAALLMTLFSFAANAAVTEQPLYDVDFEDLSVGTTLPSNFTWSNTGTAKIIEEGGNKVLELAAGGYNYIFIGDNIEGDFVIELKMKIVTHIAKGGAQFTFREDKSKNNARYGYHVCYGDCTNNQFGLDLRKRVMNDFSELVHTPLTNDGAWHQFKAEVTGSNVKLYFDGQKVADQTMTGYDSGWITISAYLDTVLFDDIKVSKLVEGATEPDTAPDTNPATDDSFALFFSVTALVFTAVQFKKRAFAR